VQPQAERWVHAPYEYPSPFRGRHTKGPGRVQGLRDALQAKVGEHTTGKGCHFIKKLADVDQKVLQTLIAKSLATMRARHSS